MCLRYWTLNSLTLTVQNAKCSWFRKQQPGQTCLHKPFCTVYTKMAAIVDGQSLALVALVFTVLALVKLSFVVISLVKVRWKSLELTKGIETGGLKEPHLLFGNLHEVTT